MQASSSTADSKWINVKQSICEIVQASSSSSSSKPDHSAYSTADSKRILTLVSEKAPNYCWYTNNCYWYAGSVYETVRVGLEGVKEEKTDEYERRGKVKAGWWWFPVGSDPGKIFKSLYSTLDGIASSSHIHLIEIVLIVSTHFDMRSFFFLNFTT